MFTGVMKAFCLLFLPDSLEFRWLCTHFSVGRFRLPWLPPFELFELTVFLRIVRRLRLRLRLFEVSIVLCFSFNCRIALKRPILVETGLLTFSNVV